MGTTRGLSSEFMDDLRLGHLKPLLNLVKGDHTLCMQIRNEYINIYYRGGNILKVEKKNEFYFTFFEEKYCNEGDEERKRKIVVDLPKQLANNDDVAKWVNTIPFIKQIMNEYFAKHSKNEREFQQLVARENNFSSISNDTDYFITDIEYTHPESKESRFDLIGIKWVSSSQERRKGSNCELVLIEMKYGDSALGGSAGIQKHIKDVDEFCGNKSKLDTLKKETISSFKQLRALGLVKFGGGGNENLVDNLRDEKPEFILLFANHKPNKSELKSEFNIITEMKNAHLKVATSSFMGYGLYNENMLSVEEFKKRYK